MASHSAVEVLDFLDAALATQDQAERRKTTSMAIGGLYQGWWTRPVNSDTDNDGSQEDDRGKLVFLLSFS